jgi:hypothetical protein
MGKDIEFGKYSVVPRVARDCKRIGQKRRDEI